MSAPAVLLERLDRIGESLRDSGHALALIGLGSVGLERERLDAHSDLDFFAIVEPGHKARYIERLQLDSSLGAVRGVFVAQSIKPQAKVLAESRGFRWVEIDYDTLRGMAPDELRLF